MSIKYMNFETICCFIMRYIPLFAATLLIIKYHFAEGLWRTCDIHPFIRGYGTNQLSDENKKTRWKTECSYMDYNRRKRSELPSDIWSKLSLFSCTTVDDSYFDSEIFP